MRVCIFLLFLVMLSGCAKGVPPSEPGGVSSTPKSVVNPLAYMDADDYSLGERDPDEIDEGMTVDGIYEVQTTQYVSLRISPQANAPRLRKLSSGMLLKVLSVHGRFVRVMTQQGARGYVMSDYLILADRAMPTSQADEPGQYTIICENYITLRDAAQQGGAVTAKLTAGTQVELEATEEAFARIYVKHLGQEGYVLRDFLCKGFMDTTWDSPDKPNGAMEDTEWIVACEEFLSLREGPSISAQRLEKLGDGARVTLLGYEGRFAKVRYGGKEGYVLSGYLTSAEKDTGLDVITPTDPYGYDQMITDLRALEAAYPDQLSIDTLGKSGEGRDIPVAILGDEAAARHVLVQAAIHGREHMTTLLVMAQLEYMLTQQNGAMTGVCFHIIPMMNPDGVVISQGARMDGRLYSIYEQDRSLGYTVLGEKDYLKRWKANAFGVDLNRNFDADWGRGRRNAPSYGHFDGFMPEDQPETWALADYTRANAFDATLSYHAQGSVIYWNYGDDERANTLSRDLARVVRAVSGYQLTQASDGDSGGFKDWVLSEYGIPSLTLEVGTRECPLPMDEFDSIWARNRDILPTVAKWVKGR